MKSDFMTDDGSGKSAAAIGDIMGRKSTKETILKVFHDIQDNPQTSIQASSLRTGISWEVTARHFSILQGLGVIRQQALYSSIIQREQILRNMIGISGVFTPQEKEQREKELETMTDLELCEKFGIKKNTKG